MEAQEVYDSICCHLYTQGRPARTPENTCRYRLDIGAKRLKCSVGSQIPDTMYDEQMESRAVIDLAKLYPHLPQWFNDHVMLLQELQIAHDHSKVYENGQFIFDELEKSLRSIATTNNLIPYSRDRHEQRMGQVHR